MKKKLEKKIIPKSEIVSDILKQIEDQFIQLGAKPEDLQTEYGKYAVLLAYKDLL